MILVQNGYTDINVRQPFHKDTQNNKKSPKPFHHGGFGDFYKPINYAN